MPSYTISIARVAPPEGRTEFTRKLHRFQESTVDRLGDMAEEVGQQASEELRSRLLQAFNSDDSTGRTADSVKFAVKEDRQKGVSLNLYIGAFRQVPFMTNLAGGRWHSGPYRIWAQEKKFLNFYWRKMRTRFRGKVVKHPGFPAGDIPMEVSLKYRDIFTARSMESVSRGIVEMTSGSKSRARLKSSKTSFRR